MIAAPNMLLLGSAGRHAGKTEFACHLIRREVALRSVVAVKITTVRDREAGCPRGGKGCGVCSTLRYPYALTEETHATGHHDTVRMKRAGAAPVFWLRVLQEHMREGLDALWSRIPPEACVVCESNAARTVVEPGAFLVLREAARSDSKRSCADVMEGADRIILFRGGGWDFSPDGCRFEGGRWFVPAEATAAVLAGGQSRRMGVDKSLLIYRGKPLLEHIVGQLHRLADEVLIGSNDPIRHGVLGVRVVPDEEPGQGPLMGIFSCVRAARHDRVLVTACDIPDLPVDLLRDLLRQARHADVVLPRHSDGRLEPLPAVYTRRALPALEATLRRGNRRIVDILQEPGLRTLFVPLPEGMIDRHFNTPEEYRRALLQESADIPLPATVGACDRSGSSKLAEANDDAEFRSHSV